MNCFSESLLPGSFVQFGHVKLGRQNVVLFDTKKGLIQLFAHPMNCCLCILYQCNLLAWSARYRTWTLECLVIIEKSETSAVQFASISMLEDLISVNYGGIA